MRAAFPEHGLGPGRLTRRRFLGAAGGAAAAALAACASPRRILRADPAERETQVIVAGGGLAGLACAFRLKQAGVRVRLLEAQSRLGGRVLTLRDFFPDGQTAELGAEFVSSSDRNLIALAGELGVELEDLGEDILRDPIHWHFEGRSRSREEVVYELRPIVERIRRDLDLRRHEGPVFHADPNGLEAVDEMSLSAWLDAAGATGWIRRLVESAWTAEVGVEPDRQSALNLVLVLDDDFLHSGAAGDRRFRIRGGSDALVQALARRLANEIETSSPVEAIRELPSWSWSVTVRRADSSVDLEADHLVLAIPFPLLREIDLGAGLPKIKRYAIDHLGYGTTTKIALGFGERAWRRVYQTRATVLTDAGFQTAWEAAAAVGSARGVLVAQAGGERGLALGAESLELQANAVLEGLDVVFPGLSTTRAGGRAARLGWSNHPWARGSRPFYAPRQWTLFGGIQAERIGRLHFAGDHTSYPAQGTMEGAIESANRAAQEILGT